MTPPPSNGQAAPAPAAGAPAAAGEDPAMTIVLNDVVSQQAMIADNQMKIDAKLATISESLRLARIYVGRGGGKTP